MLLLLQERAELCESGVRVCRVTSPLPIPLANCHQGHYTIDLMTDSDRNQDSSISHDSLLGYR